MKKEELLTNTYIGEGDTDDEKQEIKRRGINPSDFFVIHRKLDQVLEARKGLIFGMKGAGKTNTLLFVSEHASCRNKDVSNIILIELDVEQFVKSQPIFLKAATDKDKASLRGIWWELLAWAALHTIHHKHKWAIKDSWSKRASCYVLAVLGRQNEKFSQNQIIKRTLRAYGILEPHIWGGPIANLFQRIKRVGWDPSAVPLPDPVSIPGASVEFYPASPEPRPYHPADVLKTLGAMAGSKGGELWILLDNVEAAVDHTLPLGRKLALEALLFDIYLDNLHKDAYHNILVKLFTRWDMILQLKDDNKQKVYGKAVLIEWEHEEVVRLLLKRLLANRGIRDVVKNDTRRDYHKEINELGKEDLRSLFNRIFSQCSFVSSHADLFDYMGDFFLDAHNTIQPRFVIVWCNEIIAMEIKANPEEDAELPLFSENVIEKGFIRVSAYATRDYGWPYPEFDTHRNTLIKFLAEQDAGTWRFKNKELSHLFKDTPQPQGKEAVKAFWALGIFRQEEGKLPEDSEYSTIPLLYRQGLRPS